MFWIYSLTQTSHNVSKCITTIRFGSCPVLPWMCIPAVVTLVTPPACVGLTLLVSPTFSLRISSCCSYWVVRSPILLLNFLHPVTQWWFFSPEFSSWSSQHLGIYQNCLCPWARPHRRRSAAALGVLDHLRNLRQLLFRRQLPETGNYTESCVLGKGTPNWIVFQQTTLVVGSGSSGVKCCRFSVSFVSNFLSAWFSSKTT